MMGSSGTRKMKNSSVEKINGESDPKGAYTGSHKEFRLELSRNGDGWNKIEIKQKNR